MSEANLHIEWATLFLEGFAHAGVREIVLSPGARSTPLVAAAARTGKLRLHTIIDERSAAFFALGQAKVTGVPSLLVCTSGSAGAHYLPAVVEADTSFTPLLIVTADRPPELHRCGAPQTIDQVKLYGDHVRQYTELGLPDGSIDGLRAVRRKAVQATLLSRSPLPGPVHLNAWFRKPLEPQVVKGEEGSALAERLARVRGEAPPHPYPPKGAPNEEGVQHLAEACRDSRRGVIVCGPAALSQAGARPVIEELAQELRYPLLAEATSQIRFTGRPRPFRSDAFGLFLASERFRAEHPPEVILQIGGTLTSKGWHDYARLHRRCRRFVIAPYGWNDPENCAHALVFGPARDVLERLKESLMMSHHARPTSWAEEFSAADQTAWDAVATGVRQADQVLSEGRLARAVCAAMPPRSLLAVGNSLPVRDLDCFCPGAIQEAAVWSQRGANGVDGLISGAAGAASVRPGPVTLLLGDISFLHDLHGLAAARGQKEPLVIVVAQNNGGRIFEQLPLASSPEIDASLLHRWTTPHGLEFSHAALLFGHAYRKVETTAALEDALGKAYRTDGCTVIEAVLPPHGGAAERARITAAVRRALGDRME